MLRKELGPIMFDVLPISNGPENGASLRRFLWERELPELPVYLDPDHALAKAVGVLGLPTSILINAKGEEVGRVTGLADMEGKEIKDAIRAQIRHARMNRLKKSREAQE